MNAVISATSQLEVLIEKPDFVFLSLSSKNISDLAAGKIIQKKIEGTLFRISPEIPNFAEIRGHRGKGRF